MRKTKCLISQFTFFDRTGIQALLEKQAQKGWLLTKISAFGWKFCRIEPRKIHYAVTYFPKASAFDPEPTEQQKRFQEFCEYAGWKLAGSSAQMQVFYNEAENPIPIETEPVIELENIEASAKKNYLPAYYLLLANSILQMGLLLGRLKDDLTGVLSSNANLYTALCWICIWIMCGMELLSYYSWRRKTRKAIENGGGFVPTRGFRNAELAMLWVIVAGFIMLLLSLGGTYAVLMATVVAMLLLMILVVQGVTALLKKLGFQAKDNRNITIAVAIILSLVFSFGGISLVLKNADRWFGKEESYYEYQGLRFATYDDALPLRLEDLMPMEETGYSRFFRESESLVLGKQIANQSTHVGVDGPELYYVIYDIKLPVLYDAVLNALLHEHDDWYGANGQPINYRESDAECWKANRVFEQYAGEEPQNEYLLCYDGRVIYFRCDLVLTPEQMALVAETLIQ